MVKFAVKILATGLSILLLVVLVALLASPAPIERDSPRDLPWQLPDYRQANTAWSIGPDGQDGTDDDIGN